MKTDFDVVALGELLIDFTSAGRSNSGMRVFEQNPGGAPANVVCAIARLGGQTAFMGKIGQDMHGEFLCDVLQTEKVDTSGLILDPDYFTTLAFVELSDSGERHFSFARKPGADTQLKEEDLPLEILQNTKVFHFGSLSLTHEPSRSATLKAIQIAKASGAVISYDPNYRALLWDNCESAVEQMRSVLPWIDVIKISDEETTLLTGEQTPESASEQLVNLGIPCVVVTLGKNGALVRTRQNVQTLKPYDGPVVDTTGAGDAFWGGFLYRLSNYGIHPRDLTSEIAADYVDFANAVATLCVQKRGAIPAMPNLAEAMSLYQIK